MHDKTRIAVVANAADDLEAGKRKVRLERELTDLTAIGLEPAEVDLRQYFDDTDRLRSELEVFDALWAIGGNVIA